MATTINGSAGVTTNSGAVYDGLQRGTAVASTSGTSIDFTGIPSWVKRITVMLDGVSTNGSSPVIVQLGNAGGFELTNYIGAISEIASGSGSTNYSTGFAIDRVSGNTTSSSIRYSIVTLTNISSNTWVESHTNAYSNVAVTHSGSGVKALSATLGRLRITTVNGTDTFDAGSINILYE